MKRLLYIIIAVFIVGAWSCAESDDFSSDPNLKLSFSVDTLSFDTVFTTIGSATQTIQIYNKNNKSLTIESIEIMNPQKSGFQMNIDGESGTKLTHIDILKKDSLYGFLRITIDPLNVNNPLLIRDSIRFVTNGNIQYLYLEAIGRDVYKWNKKTISSDTLVTDEKPILIYDVLRIDENVTLTINENTELYFHDKASLQVYGTLKAKGVIGEPIVFRGDRLDNINGAIPYDNAPGLWEGIVFHKGSYNNQLENVVLKNAINGVVFISDDIQHKKASLKNTIIHNSSANGLVAVNCDIDMVNCQLTNARKALLDLSGGKYSFLHCTIANYYRWAGRMMESVVLREKEEDTGLPTLFTQCDFINSIIYGSSTTELSIPANESASLNYQFINCLIRNRTEFSNSYFSHIIWNVDPLFVDINKNGLYYYNFRLSESSPAIDQADKSYSLLAPFDINGNSRLNDANPDLGCYERIGE